jgi:hypothetical protein
MTVTINCGLPTNARDAAAFYILHRLAPIPLHPRNKVPAVAEGWADVRVTADTLDDYFPPGEARGVGLLTGAASGRLVDVDLDCPEAIAAADVLLPPTGMVFGRPSARRSHRWYRPTGRAANTRAYRAPDGKMLVESRASGCQTMAPPSIHPDGEQVEWHEFGAPGELLTDDLEGGVARVAAAALLARHWPAEGSRQDAALALSGGLARAGWPVEDVERFVGAVARAAGDDEARTRVKTADRTAQKIGDGLAATGWPTLAKLVGDDVVTCARQWLGIKGAVAAEPAEVPLPVEPPWPDPPGEEAIYGLPGRIVRTIEPASEADGVALLAQTLTAFGNAIGRSAHFVVEADRHHAVEFMLLIGKTSKARKGTSWGRVKGLYGEVVEQWVRDRIQTGLSSGEGLVWAVHDPIAKREKVNNGKGQSPSYEEVEADPGVEDKRLLVVEPEFASVLKQTERQGNTLSALLRQAWDGGDLRTLTKNSPARATGAHISLIGHITGEELRRYLTATESANGFANRFVMLCTQRSQVLPEGGEVDPAAWEGVRNELAAALEFASSVGRVERDERARALWREVYDRLSEGRPGLAGALLGRAEAHVMRLAMLYALMDSSAVIEAEHLMAALALWDYAERSVYFVFGDDLGDPVADDLLRLLRSCPAGLTRNELRDYFGRHQSSERIGRALGLLLQHHLARQERQDTRGRPAERWFAATPARTRARRTYRA